MSENKVRFDLKQVAAWDRQNDTDLKKKGENKNKTPGFYGKWAKQAEERANSTSDYRDRASERRKETTNEETQMEEIAAKMEFEQTKFLGGDIDHTHLVKGLDFALLEKMRQKYAPAEEDLIPEEEQELRLEDVETETKLGENLMKMIIKQQLGDQIEKRNNEAVRFGTVLNAQSGRKQAPASKFSSQTPRPGEILARTVFEFDTRPESETDIPVYIMKSKQDYVVNEEYVNFMMDSDMIQLFRSVLDDGKLVSAKQKKKRAAKEQAIQEAVRLAALAGTTLVTDSNGTLSMGLAPPAKTVPSALKADDFDSIYGDDVSVGKYVPAGMEESEGSGGAGSHNAAVGAGIFSAGGAAPRTGSRFGPAANATVAPVAPSAESFSTIAPIQQVEKSSEDLMKPIRELLQATQAKEKAAKERHLDIHTNANVIKNRDMMVETDKTGKALVHRDVFATTKGKVVSALDKHGKMKTSSKVGEVFGTNGTYDLFPETTGSYEQYDSDDGGRDDPEDGPAAKKSRLSAMNDGDDAGDGGGASSSRRSGGGSEWERPLSSGGGSGFGIDDYADGGGNSFKAFAGSQKMKGSATPWARHGTGHTGGGASSGSSQAKKYDSKAALHAAQFSKSNR